MERRISLSILLALLLAACATSAPVIATPLSTRPATPRVAPVPPEARDAAQQRMMQGRGAANIYATLANHPELAEAWTPLSNLIFNGSSLPPRHREMIMLRIGWLCQAEYEWAQHAAIALRNGLTEAEVRAVALGPDAPGWSPFERDLLRMVDELRYEGGVSDDVWAGLKTQYGDARMMDAVFTAAQYEVVSTILNSAGVQLDANLRYRLPADAPPPALAGRVAPKHRAARFGNGDLATILARRAPLLTGLEALADGVAARTALAPRARALLKLRTAWLLGADATWATFAGEARSAGLTSREIAAVANGRSAVRGEAERALLDAADDLRREAFVTDPVWMALSRHYGPRERVEILYVVGEATLTALAANSYGAERPKGAPAMPR